MNEKPKLFEWKGYFLAILSFFFCLFFYSSYSAELYYSALGAFLSAALIYLSYIIIRMLSIAMR